MGEVMSSMKKILDWLKGIIGDKLLAIIISQILTKENILKAVDYVLDIAENYAAKTEADWDDKVLKTIREALNVPDNDVQP